MSLIKISLKNSFAYRSSVLFNIIGSMFSIYISIALWKYVYSYDVSKMNYMVIYVILSNTIRLFYSDGIGGEIGRKVIDGTFALELIRPVNFVYLSYMRNVGRIIANVIMRGIPVILLFLPLIIRHGEIIQYHRIWLFIFAVLLGHFLYTILYALIGFMSFIFLEVWPFQRLLNDTIRFLSGSFIPLALFPDWLKRVATFFPFRFLYAFPIEILLGNLSANEIQTSILTLCIWITGLFALFILLYKRAVNLFVVQGG